MGLPRRGIAGCAVRRGLALRDDRPPRQARWLEPEERDWLEKTLDAERKEVAPSGVGLLRLLRSPAVWLLALGICATNIGGYAAAFWLPTVVKDLLMKTRGAADPTDVLNWLGIAYLFGLAGVWVSGRSSDRLGDRKWHCIVGQVMAGVCLAASVGQGMSWTAVFAWLCAFEFFAFFWPSPFWVLPTLTLSASEAAVAIGFINICANVAGLLGSPVIGEMRRARFRRPVVRAGARRVLRRRGRGHRGPPRPPAEAGEEAFADPRMTIGGRPSQALASLPSRRILAPPVAVFGTSGEGEAMPKVLVTDFTFDRLDVEEAILRPSASRSTPASAGPRRNSSRRWRRPTTCSPSSPSTRG